MSMPLSPPEGSMSLHQAQDALMNQLSDTMIGEPASAEAPASGAADNADADEPEEPAAEAAGAAGDDAPEPDPDAAPEGDGEAASFETLSEVAEAAGLSVEDFLAAIKHTVKRNGAEETVTLAEAIADGLRHDDYTRKTTQLAEEKRTLKAQRQFAEQQLEQLHVAFQARMNAAFQHIETELQSPNLAALRETEPDVWQAKHYELSLNKQAIAQRAHEDIQQYQTAMAQRIQNRQVEAAELLRQRYPDWGDEHRSRVSRAFEAYGMGSEDLQAISAMGDHRLIAMAHDLAALRAEKEAGAGQQAAAAATVKKLKRLVPKVEKPTKGSTQAQQDSAGFARSMKQLHKTGRVEDAAQAIMSKLGDRLL